MKFSIQRAAVRASSAVVAALICTAGLRPSIVHAQPPVAGHAIVITEPDNRAGPRFGVAYLTRGSETARNESKAFYPLTSLFGWQIEHQIDVGPEFPTVMTELVMLVGGLEQNVVLPSATWLIGIRQANGLEFGVGPSVNGSGTQLAFAAGVTHRFSKVNIPINVAIAPARVGAALSVTAGFNTRQ